MMDHASTKDVRCNECYKIFPTSTDLGQHVKDEHRLECEVCNRTFSRLAHLQSHIEIHKGESLFNCRVCSAGFQSEHLYKKHVRGHSRAGAARSSSKLRQSHPCTVCEKAFTDVNLLMEHYRSEEHRDRVQEIGLGGASILHTIEGGELSPEIRSLVDEVAGSIGASEADKGLMEGLRGDEGVSVIDDLHEDEGISVMDGLRGDEDVPVMDGGSGGYVGQVADEGMCSVGTDDRPIEC